MEKVKGSLNVVIDVKAINYQNGNVMESHGKLKTVFGGKPGIADEDTLTFRGSDCGKATMEANYSSTAAGNDEKSTDVELSLKGGVLNDKKEIVDAISAGAKLTKADAGRDANTKVEDFLKLKIENSCDAKCASTESFYTTKTSEIIK